jgi:hypothetical protein
MLFAIEILRGIIGFMEKRRYFFVALVLIILAICSSLASQACFASATIKHIQILSDKANKTLLEQELKQYQTKAKTLVILSLVLAAFFVFFSVISVVKKEPVFHSILVVFGITYLLSTLMYV